MSVVVAGRVPVVTTGVTGEHQCVSCLLVVIKREEKSLIGLFVIRGDRRSCVKNGQKVSVKAGGFGFASFGKVRKR